MLEKGDKIREYSLIRFLGRGQFGEVWLAEKKVEFSTKGLHFALKFLFDTTGQGVDISRVKDEVETAIRVSGQQNVNRIFEAFVDKDRYVIVSDYADGGSLGHWLLEHNGKAPTIAEATRIMKGTLNGLVKLHSNGVVHRDLKPENILLHNHEPYISDFGTSRVMNSLSNTQTAAGSPQYMSPESFVQSKKPSVDIWSAGVLFYQLLSGEMPFVAENLMALMKLIETQSPKPLPNTVPLGLRRVVERALEKQPGKRFRSAQEMLQALEMCENPRVIPNPDPTPEPPPRLPDPKPDIPPFGVEAPKTDSKRKKKWLRIGVPVGVLAGIALLFVFLGTGLFAQGDLVPYRKGDLFGFSNSKKKIVIEPRFEEVTPFQDGLAMVKLNGKWGVINRSGEQIIRSRYEDVKMDSPEQQFLLSNRISPKVRLFAVKLSNKWGFVDVTDKPITQFKYDNVQPFIDNLAIVTVNVADGDKSKEKSGLIDQAGKELTAIKYDRISYYFDGLMMVGLEGKFGFVDATGNEVIPLRFDNAQGGKGLLNLLKTNRNDSGLFPVAIKEKWGFIDKSGKEIIPFIYEIADAFVDGLAVVGVNKKLGFINTSGKEIIPPKYESGYFFSQGLAAVKKNDKWGFVDSNGAEILPFNWDSVSPAGFSNNLIAVKKDKKWGFIDRDGKVVVPLEYDASEKSDSGPFFHDGVALVRKKGLLEDLSDSKWGFVDSMGNQVIPLKYDSAQPFVDGVSRVTFKGKSFFIDKNGTEFIEGVIFTDPTPAANTPANTVANAANKSSNMANAANIQLYDLLGSQNKSTSNSTTTTSYVGKTGVLDTNLNLRSDSKDSSKVLGVHYKGARVKILEQVSYPKDGIVSTWVKVEVVQDGCDAKGILGCSHEGESRGWMNAKYLTVK